MEVVEVVEGDQGIREGGVVSASGDGAPFLCCPSNIIIMLFGLVWSRRLVESCPLQVESLFGWLPASRDAEQ